jgi:hypothetical protein
VVREIGPFWVKQIHGKMFTSKSKFFLHIFSKANFHSSNSTSTKQQHFLFHFYFSVFPIHYLFNFFQAYMQLLLLVFYPSFSTFPFFQETISLPKSFLFSNGIFHTLKVCNNKLLTLLLYPATFLAYQHLSDGEFGNY